MFRAMRPRQGPPSARFRLDIGRGTASAPAPSAFSHSRATSILASRPSSSSARRRKASICPALLGRCPRRPGLAARRDGTRSAPDPARRACPEIDPRAGAAANRSPGTGPQGRPSSSSLPVCQLGPDHFRTRSLQPARRSSPWSVLEADRQTPPLPDWR